MKNNLKLLSFLLLVVSVAAHAQTSTFNYTGSVQTWTVPVGVSSIAIDIKGASGGTSTYYSPGGCGGEVQCTLAVTPGQVLNIFVGGIGGDGSYYGAGAGGYNGGGNGGLSFFSGGAGGGGATDIRIGGVGLANRVASAGGGAGGGDDYGGLENGGDGGGAGTAGDGLDGGAYFAFTCGAGATPVAGGAGAIGGGTSGVSLTGGDGGGYFFTDGGGGGGGYFGGGGGYAGGGGGGSSYTDPSIASSVVHIQGANCGSDGIATITVLCTTPTAGPIVGPSSICLGSTVTYTTPTSTPGGTWSSSAPLIATVNPVTGDVTAIGAGPFTLTYDIVLSCGSATTSLPITAIATAAPISGGPDSVCQSSSSAINTVTFTDPTPGGTWSSSNTAVATIDPTFGIAIASSTTPGVTTISYTVGSCSATVVLTVNPLPSAIVGSSTVCRFLTTTLTDPTPGGVWSSTVPAAATVGSSTGVVTGVSLGATNIYYTLPTGCEVSQFVSVSQPPLPITGPSQVCEGNAIVLTELVGGGTWSSSAPANASVTSGIVTGLMAATVTIAYTMPSCPPATHVVTVNPLPAVITGPTAVCTGMTTTLMDATPGGAWSSSDPAVTVSSTGDVTSSVPGISATIYYTLPTTCFVSAMVNVNVPPTPIVSAHDTICKDDTMTFYNATPGGIWSTTNLAIAQVIDSTGFGTGISAGTVNVSYTLPTGCFAVKPLVIDPLLPGSVGITYSPAGIICDSTVVTFDANPVNGGTATYIWEKFSVPLGPIDSTGTYSYMPTHGDVITCIMMPHGVCALHDTVSDTVVMNVYPNNVVPTVTISTTGPDTVAYVGQVVTFFSVVTFGGTMPTYQWYRNGLPIPGAIASSYTTPVYASDTFWCVVNGNPPCATIPTPPGISNQIIIHNYLGISPIANGNNDLSLYPNPNNGSFTLTGHLATSSNNDVSYEVTNMLGQVIQKGTITPHNGDISHAINLENIAMGSYLLKVNTEKGSETFHFVIGK